VENVLAISSQTGLSVLLLLHDIRRNDKSGISKCVFFIKYQVADDINML
jgi:hypothetical protein